MSPRTLTAAPDDRSMWRRALAKLHPDGGGSHDLFIWAGAVRDVVCGSSLRAGAIPESEDHPSRRRGASTEAPARVPYPPDSDFAALNARAVAMAEEIGGVRGYLLEMLADCEAPPSTTGAWEQRGASYKKLAAIGHMVGMSQAERVRWYRIAEAVPLSDRHAGHILGRLKKAAA
jgi:hypothetical protein